MSLVLRWMWWMIAVGQAYNLGTSQTLAALSDTYHTPELQAVGLTIAIAAALFIDAADWWIRA